eukprot:m.179771 g.179771  ORF g.179771 m.179771 type:complete len:60 (-) comp21451_c0_seq1:50-229(-)
MAYGFSFGPVTWLILGEIFPDNMRGRAVAAVSVVNWTSNLIVSISFLSVMSECKDTLDE